MRNLKVQIGCIMCGKTTVLMLDKVDVAAWKGGALIQHVMPYLTVDERELLISRLCFTCFDTVCAETV